MQDVDSGPKSHDLGLDIRHASGDHVDTIIASHFSARELPALDLSRVTGHDTLLDMLTAKESQSSRSSGASSLDSQNHSARSGWETARESFSSEVRMSNLPRSSIVTAVLEET